MTYKDNKGREQSFPVPVTQDVIEQTERAKLFSPPEKPEVQAEGFWGELAILFFGFLATCFVSTTAWENKTLNIAIVVGAVLFVLVIRILRSSAKYNKALARVQKVEIPRWNEAMTNWNLAYHCPRDDIVFIPDDPNNRWFDSTEIKKLLYEQ
jgi:hypothetical protein